MQRKASVIGLPPENLDEYRHLHADVWPGVLARLTASNIANSGTTTRAWSTRIRCDVRHGWTRTVSFTR